MSLLIIDGKHYEYIGEGVYVTRDDAGRIIITENNPMPGLATGTVYIGKESFEILIWFLQKSLQGETCDQALHGECKEEIDRLEVELAEEKKLAWLDGYEYGLTAAAWWKDDVEYVGSPGGITLQKAIERSADAYDERSQSL